MKLIKPDFTILSPVGDSILENIERAGRVCYKSEDKITGQSSLQFVKMLIKRGHESVLEHEKISVLFICDRGVSHELVRHRLASFSQESTRYCNYGKDNFGNQLTFIIPLWVNWPKDNEPEYDTSAELWYNSLKVAEYTYKKLLKEGWTPQQARTVLPNSLKTEIVATANLREWRTILKQRTSTAAHPQMRELMCPLLEELKKKLPVVFEDITY